MLKPCLQINYQQDLKASNLWAFCFWFRNGQLYLRVDETSEVTMQPFIPWDEFIGECQTRHKTPLLQPEDSTKAVQNKETWTEDHFAADNTSENSNKQATQKINPTLHDPLPAVLWISEQSCTSQKRKYPLHRQRPRSFLRRSQSCEKQTEEKISQLITEFTRITEIIACTIHVPRLWKTPNAHPATIIKFRHGSPQLKPTHYMQHVSEPSDRYSSPNSSSLDTILWRQVHTCWSSGVPNSPFE